MGSLPQAIEALSTYLDEPLPRTKQISRHLLDAEFLPKSAGKRIEQLSAAHIATFLLALSVARKPAGAVRAVDTWEPMTPNGKVLQPAERIVADDPPQFMLVDMIALLIRLAWQGNGAGPLMDGVLSSTVEITTTRPHAIVEFIGRRIEYLPLGGERPSGRQRVDRIPGATIHQIAMALREGAPIPDTVPAESFPFDLLKSA